MKKKKLEILGIVLAIVDAVMIASAAKASSARAFTELDGALIVIILGFVATVRGSWWWLVLTGVGIAEAVVVAYRGTGG